VGVSAGVAWLSGGTQKKEYSEAHSFAQSKVTDASGRGATEFIVQARQREPRGVKSKSHPGPHPSPGPHSDGRILRMIFWRTSGLFCATTMIDSYSLTDRPLSVTALTIALSASSAMRSRSDCGASSSFFS
jgi:hypothetical protein